MLEASDEMLGKFCGTHSLASQRNPSQHVIVRPLNDPHQSPTSLAHTSDVEVIVLEMLVEVLVEVAIETVEVIIETVVEETVDFTSEIVVVVGSQVLFVH